MVNLKTLSKCEVQQMIHFIGNAVRGKRLAEIVNGWGWKMSMATRVRPTFGKDCDNMPVLVILDGFPESETARSAYYRLRRYCDIRFIALNDSPKALKFLHVNALSFIKILKRDPQPTELIDAIVTLLRSMPDSSSRHSLKIDFLDGSDRCKLTGPCAIRGEACC